MSSAILFLISLTFILLKVIAIEIFTKYKNLMLSTFGLAISSHIIIDHTQTI